MLAIIVALVFVTSDVAAAVFKPQAANPETDKIRRPYVILKNH